MRMVIVIEAMMQSLRTEVMKLRALSRPCLSLRKRHQADSVQDSVIFAHSALGECIRPRLQSFQSKVSNAIPLHGMAGNLT